TAFDLNSSFGWICNPAQDFQKRALPRAIPADDAEHLALLDLKRDAFKGPELFALPRFTGDTRAEPFERSAQDAFHDMAKAVAFGTLMADHVALPEVLNANYGRGHECVANQTPCGQVIKKSSTSGIRVTDENRKWEFLSS